ncbi:MAG TPA: hypothetical protein VN641_13695 [Urbifossiella sp.]|nr:hypothetical protein [Urbifossiella sp.]
MGFFSGRVSCLRFQVSGSAPRSFTEEHVDRLADRQAGRQRIASADGIEVGWTAGDHILDTDFGLEKNIINDALHFELRIDSESLPADLMRAYYAVELKALTKNNPSGFPSARQKREAKESARERLEEEAKDGRFRKRKCVPVLWDRLSNEVLFGATSITHVDRLCSLFEQTFQKELECVTAGPRAFQLAELHGRTRQVDDSAPSAFLPGITPADVAWIADESSRDFLGNEFLLWLWYYTDVESDTLKLADDSEATVMMARSLTLECPRGQTGHETISHEGPTRLPESRRAIQSGKLPRKAGLTLVRHSQQYELAIHAETLAIASAKLPAPPEDVTEARAKLEERATQLRSLLETLDLLYDAFGRRRFGKEWEADLTAMQKWLKREERRG